MATAMQSKKNRKNRGQIVITEEWLLDTLNRYLDTPPDMEVIDFMKDMFSPRYYLTVASESFQEVPEAAPYPRIAVQGNSLVASWTPEKKYEHNNS
jgi:hypothetical protein